MHRGVLPVTNSLHHVARLALPLSRSCDERSPGQRDIEKRSPSTLVQCGVALLCVLGGASPASAQSPFTRAGFSAIHDTHTVFPYEHVDPASGNLLLMQTDLVLPGNAGFDLVVQRVYNSKVHPGY